MYDSNISCGKLKPACSKSTDAYQLQDYWILHTLALTIS